MPHPLKTVAVAQCDSNCILCSDLVKSGQLVSPYCGRWVHGECIASMNAALRDYDGYDVAWRRVFGKRSGDSEEDKAALETNIARVQRELDAFLDAMDAAEAGYNCPVDDYRGYTAGQHDYASGKPGYAYGQHGYASGQHGYAYGQHGYHEGYPAGQYGYAAGHVGYTTGQYGYTAGQPYFDTRRIYPSMSAC